VGLLISPSVLNADLSRLHEEVARVSAVADMIHLDVMDAHFVPNLTFGLPVVESLLAGTEIPADIHLMIEDPDTWAPRYAEAGCYSVTFHIEAARDAGMTARAIRGAGARSAIALKPATEIEAIDAYLPFLDMILIMTVEPGWGGQPFLDTMLPKVREARRRADDTGLDIWVQVDGGVSEDTIGPCTEAGANVFVAGSVVYRSSDPAATVQALRTRAEAAAR
jgi:ribulose-phosphate 3-epimerase